MPKGGPFLGILRFPPFFFLEVFLRAWCWKPGCFLVVVGRGTKANVDGGCCAAQESVDGSESLHCTYCSKSQHHYYFMFACGGKYEVASFKLSYLEVETPKNGLQFKFFVFFSDSESHGHYYTFLI